MNDFRKFLKKILIDEDITLTEVVERLNKKNNNDDTVQNLSNKLSRNTLKYQEAKDIAEVIGYEIIWVKKNNIR